MIRRDRKWRNGVSLGFDRKGLKGTKGKALQVRKENVALAGTGMDKNGRHVTYGNGIARGEGKTKGSRSATSTPTTWKGRKLANPACAETTSDHSLGKGLDAQSPTQYLLTLVLTKSQLGSFLPTS